MTEINVWIKMVGMVGLIIKKKDYLGSWVQICAATSRIEICMTSGSKRHPPPVCTVCVFGRLCLVWDIRIVCMHVRLFCTEDYMGRQNTLVIQLCSETSDVLKE